MRSRPERPIDNNNAGDSRPDLTERSSRRQIILLVLFGIATGIIYLVAFALPFFLPNNYSLLTDLGGLTQHQPSSFVSLIAAIAALYVLYWLAYSLTKKEPRLNLVAMIVGFGLAFALIMVFMYPVTAIDIFGYIVRTRILTVHEANPFTTLPSAFPQDPFFQYIGNWRDWPTPYGPLFILLGAIPSLIADNNLLLNLLLFKILALVSYYGNIVLIYLIVSRIAPQMAVPAVIFYAWNPLVLFEALGNGHNDATMMVFVLLAFYLMMLGRMEGAVVAMVASVLIKYITLLLLPLVIIYALNSYPTWRQRTLFVARASVASAIFAALSYAPFWQGLATFKGFLGQADIYISSLPTLALLMLQPHTGPAANAYVKIITGVSFLAIYVWLLKGLRCDLEQYLIVGAKVFFAYLIVACAQFESWYVIWPITLAALIQRDNIREYITAFSIGALLSVALFAFVWPWTRVSFFEMNLIAVSAVLLPLFALWVFLSFESWKRGRSEIGAWKNP